MRWHDRWHLREAVFTAVFCRRSRHCRPRNRVHKFNGGNPCWLCRNCRLTVVYDFELRERQEQDRR